MKLEEHLTKLAVRRFVGNDALGNGVNNQKRLGRANSATVSQRRVLGQQIAFLMMVTEPLMSGPRKPLPQAMTISSFRTIILTMMWCRSSSVRSTA
jgi:hypothetical protein